MAAFRCLEHWDALRPVNFTSSLRLIIVCFPAEIHQQHISSTYMENGSLRPYFNKEVKGYHQMRKNDTTPLNSWFGARFRRGFFSLFRWISAGSIFNLKRATFSAINNCMITMSTTLVSIHKSVIFSELQIKTGGYSRISTTPWLTSGCFVAVRQLNFYPA